MKDGQRQGRTGAELLEAGEAALEAGDSANAFALLQQASEVGVDLSVLDRLARAFARAGRYQGRHNDVRDWVEAALAHDIDTAHRLALLRARIMMWRQLDVARVGDLIAEALDAADQHGDEEAYADILAHAAFAAYRRGDARMSNVYVALASERTFTSPVAQFAAIRVKLFAAIIAGDLEQGINLSTKARAAARQMGDVAGTANESNNLAEFYLDLGYPRDACAHADEAIRLAGQCGHRHLELFGESLSANAGAQLGAIDGALERFAVLRPTDLVFAVDIAAAHSFWLLERRAAHDAAAARAVVETAIEQAERARLNNRLTALYANLARCHISEGDSARARVAVEKARVAGERAEVPSQLLLALAVAEVLPASDPKRRAVLNQARGRILRTAERREDPRSYCANVRLNRRLLELSGGVPGDLPPAQSQ